MGKSYWIDYEVDDVKLGGSLELSSLLMRSRTTDDRCVASTDNKMLLAVHSGHSSIPRNPGLPWAAWWLEWYLRPMKTYSWCCCGWKVCHKSRWVSKQCSSPLSPTSSGVALLSCNKSVSFKWWLKRYAPLKQWTSFILPSWRLINSTTIWHTGWPKHSDT